MKIGTNNNIILFPTSSYIFKMEKNYTAILETISTLNVVANSSCYSRKNMIIIIYEHCAKPNFIWNAYDRCSI